MSVRTLKPNTNAQRQKSYLNNEEITKTTPEKSLVVTKKLPGPVQQADRPL